MLHRQVIFVDKIWIALDEITAPGGWPNDSSFWLRALSPLEIPVLTAQLEVLYMKRDYYRCEKL